MSLTWRTIPKSKCNSVNRSTFRKCDDFLLSVASEEYFSEPHKTFEKLSIGKAHTIINSRDKIF